MELCVLLYKAEQISAVEPDPKHSLGNCKKLSVNTFVLGWKAVNNVDKQDVILVLLNLIKYIYQKL